MLSTEESIEEYLLFHFSCQCRRKQPVSLRYAAQWGGGSRPPGVGLQPASLFGAEVTDHGGRAAAAKIYFECKRRSSGQLMSIRA